MKLYIDPMAPNPYRVTLFLQLKGVQLDTEVLSIANGDVLTDHFKALNPMCTVPVLQLDDGTCFSEVPAIYLYLESQFPEPNLLGVDVREQALVREWMHRILLAGVEPARDILRNSVPFFANRALAGPVNTAQIPELVTRAQSMLEFFWELIDNQLANNQFVCGDRFTAADIDLVTLLRFGKAINISAPQHCLNIQRWKEDSKQTVTT